MAAAGYIAVSNSSDRRTWVLVGFQGDQLTIGEMWMRGIFIKD